MSQILMTYARGFTRIHLVVAIRAMVGEVLELILQPVSFVQIFCSLLLWLVISGGKRSIRNHNYYYINYGSETVNLRTHLPTAHKRKGKKKQNKKFHEMQ